MSKKDRAHRTLKHGSSVTASIIASLAIVLMVNYLSMRHFRRFDWTGTSQYSLSDKTEKILSSLKREVEVYALWSQQDPKFMHLQELLKGYESESKNKIKLEMIDPDLSPERFQILLGRYGAKVRTDISGQVVDIDAGLFVVCGENVKYLSQLEFESFDDEPSFGDEQPQEEKISKSNAEQNITSAILYVISEKRATLCLSTGHGEMDIAGESRRTIQHVVETLKSDSYNVETIAIAPGVKIESKCDTLFIVGPERSFSAEEAQKIEDFLLSGKSALFLLEPIFEQTTYKKSGLEEICSKWGIKLNDDFILETDTVFTS